mgnify:CR=1 FL=1
MEKIGIICEYNPFHNGHIYHIKKIKEMYPNSLIILILNGYFLQRGEISIISKYDNITKFSVEDPSLNEIFISIVGDSYEIV